MSEYWVSTPKYWCKHCSAFVVDTPLGRRNHEATLKHKGALQRFLRDLHRSNEKESREREHAKREVARLNALVSGTSAASSSASSSSTVSVGKPEQRRGTAWGAAARPSTELERKAHIKQLEALGVAVPDAYRADLALPGEWTAVRVQEDPAEKEQRRRREAADEAARATRDEERKRKWDELDDDEKELRGFKIRTQTYPGEEAREGVDFKLLFKKKKFVAKADGEEGGSEVKREAGDVKTEGGDLGIKEEDVEVKTEDTKVKKEEPGGPPVKREEEDEEDTGALNGSAAVDKKPSIKTEDAAPAPPRAETDAVLFKKRKAKNIRKK